MAQEVTILKVFEMANYAVVAWERSKSVEYVACWLPKIRNANGDWVPPTKLNEGVTDVKCYWEQGHYFTDKKQALLYAADKELEAIQYKIDSLERYAESVERSRHEDEKYNEEIIEERFNGYDVYDPFEGEVEEEDDDPTQGDEIRTPWGGLVD